jgi:hypothetical protein
MMAEAAIKSPCGSAAWGLAGGKVVSAAPKLVTTPSVSAYCHTDTNGA